MPCCAVHCNTMQCKRASEQAMKQASRQAGRQAGKRGSKEARKQEAKKQAKKHTSKVATTMLSCMLHALEWKTTFHSKDKLAHRRLTLWALQAPHNANCHVSFSPHSLTRRATDQRRSGLISAAIPRQDDARDTIKVTTALLSCRLHSLEWETDHHS